jgi:TonB family protein
MKLVLAFALLILPLFAGRNNWPTTWVNYPPLALAARIQGDVILEVTADKNGKIQNITLISGPNLLVEEAERAMKAWHFGPAFDGDPETITERFTYAFRLDQFVTGKRIEYDRDNNTIVVSAASPSIGPDSASLITER